MPNIMDVKIPYLTPPMRNRYIQKRASLPHIYVSSMVSTHMAQLILKELVFQQLSATPTAIHWD